MEPVPDRRQQHEQHHRDAHAHRPRDGLRLVVQVAEENVFQGAAHRRMRTFLSRVAPAHAMSRPDARYMAAATANAEIPAAESFAILATSAVSSRPGRGTCDASEVDSISPMSSEVMGCTTERSACGNTTEEMMTSGRMPRLRAASTWPPSTVLMPVRR